MDHAHHALRITIYIKVHVLHVQLCPIALHALPPRVQVVPITLMYFMPMLVDCAVKYYQDAIHAQVQHQHAQLA